MILRPILQPILRPVMAPIGRRDVIGFNPATLWRNGEPAVHLSIEVGMRRNAAVGYDPSQCVLFQDSAATTPVTAVEQPLGYIKDLSGRGNDFYQPSNTASRSIIRLNESGRHYADPDGVDDWLESVNTLNMSAALGVQLVVGVRAESDAAPGVIFEFGQTSTVTGSFYIGRRMTAESSYTIAANAGVPANVTGAGFHLPSQAVLSAWYRSAASPLLSLRVNGVQAAQSTSNQGGGPYGNLKAYLFRRAGSSLPFNGRFYGLTLVGRVLSDTELRRLEQWHRNMGRIY